ncbi:MAG: BTB/POZ domain-containing protein [Chlamydiota bacterium]
MDLPVALPHHLAFLEKIENENEMLQVLIKEPVDLVLFFEKACVDNAWALSHRTVMSKILSWATYQFLHGVLAVEMAEKIQELVFAYHELLSHSLPRDITVVSGGNTYPVNSLMFGMSSSIFYTFFRQECIEKEKREIEFREVPGDIFEAMIEFIHSGRVEDLWKAEKSFVMKTLQQASDWEMGGLVAYCANIYKRYIHTVNAVSTLKVAHQNSWNELKKSAIEFINEQALGVSFHEVGTSDLYMHFHRYSKEAMEVFHELSKDVTFLGFEYELLEDRSFTKVITHAPSLKGVDLQNTRTFSERLKGLPIDLEQLDLSMCEWLSEVTLKTVIEVCPHLKVLKLNSNTQLCHKCWSQLHLLDNLEHLEISRCNQISDDDFLVITRGCPYLRTLSIEGCSRLTDNSLVELSMANSGLVNVDFSRTSATDAAITELAYRNWQLRELKLHRCKSISDHAIKEVVRLASNLQSLDLSGSSISGDTKKELLAINMHLKIT